MEETSDQDRGDPRGCKVGTCVRQKQRSFLRVTLSQEAHRGKQSAGGVWAPLPLSAGCPCAGLSVSIPLLHVMTMTVHYVCVCLVCVSVCWMFRMQRERTGLNCVWEVRAGFGV